MDPARAFRDLLHALEQALRVDPRDVDALYYFGLVTAQLAARRLDALIETSPTSARANQLRAEALEAQDRRSEAEAAWEAALALGGCSLVGALLLRAADELHERLLAVATHHERCRVIEHCTVHNTLTHPPDLRIELDVVRHEEVA